MFGEIFKINKNQTDKIMKHEKFFRERKKHGFFSPVIS